ncbi:hypothetical protein CERSUDRAFT_98977 [Gelatoporia subvermispora B]|uniref:Uncharacterized protein n=1 Tax=Ceriporiopsis subvermispora (strain B) TaxID=914234 RepID=M2R272_CERS8|nr:hypothetical protein CERSUDRAFT_98977 [Gelatoporia subvermispora B]
MDAHRMQIIAALTRQLQLNKYASLSGLIAAVYDYCITVDKEVKINHQSLQAKHS